MSSVTSGNSVMIIDDIKEGSNRRYLCHLRESFAEEWLHAVGRYFQRPCLSLVLSGNGLMQLVPLLERVLGVRQLLQDLVLRAFGVKPFPLSISISFQEVLAGEPTSFYTAYKHFFQLHSLVVVFLINFEWCLSILLIELDRSSSKFYLKRFSLRSGCASFIS